jgi:hypothetical protein
MGVYCITFSGTMAKLKGNFEAESTIESVNANE